MSYRRCELLMSLSDDIQEAYSVEAVAFVSSWSLSICLVDVKSISVS